MRVMVRDRLHFLLGDYGPIPVFLQSIWRDLTPVYLDALDTSHRIKINSADLYILFLMVLDV